MRRPARLRVGGQLLHTCCQLLYFLTQATQELTARSTIVRDMIAKIFWVPDHHVGDVQVSARSEKRIKPGIYLRKACGI